MRIAVTGNIGCGKSTLVHRLLAAMPNYAHFDFDAEVHGLYDNREYLAEVQAAFGTTDRTALSDLVFADLPKKAVLEQISVKYLKASLENALQAEDLLVEFPLLVETGWFLSRFDRIITVKCSEQTQRERVKQRNGFSDEKIAAIVSAQASTDVKAAFADIAVDTDKDATDFERQVADILLLLPVSALQARCLREFGSNDIWEAIRSAYTAPSRAYHTLAHLEAMFAHYDNMAPLANGRAVRMAIWFHDIVYNTSMAEYGLNESRSAAKMFRLLRKHRPDLLSATESGHVSVTLAAEMILSTKGHKPSTSYFGTRPDALEDCKRFLDIDLSILSKSDGVVLAFDNAIRQEFSQFSEKDFASGRVHALSSFLGRDKVFYSEEFAGAESAARDSLTKLIARWNVLKGQNNA